MSDPETVTRWLHIAADVVALLAGAIGIAAWLWPTAIGSPLIYHWSREYDPA